jgi:hypothetical protein
LSWGCLSLQKKELEVLNLGGRVLVYLLLVSFRSQQCSEIDSLFFKNAGLSGKSKDMASFVNTAMQKQPKAAKTPLKKDDMTQNNPPDASDKRTGERHPERDRKKDALQPRMQFDNAHRVEKAKKRSVVNQSETQKGVELFRHLPPYTCGTLLSDLESKSFLLGAIHPSVYKVRIKYNIAIFMCFCNIAIHPSVQNK